jgi:hypothetical protein
MSAVQLLRGHQDSPVCMAFNAANGTLASGAEVGALAVFAAVGLSLPAFTQLPLTAACSLTPPVTHTAACCQLVTHPC